VTQAGIRESWNNLSPDEQLEQFRQMPFAQAQRLFFELPSRDQSELLLSMSPEESLLWMRALAPDDAADVIQEAPEQDRDKLLSCLDTISRNEVAGLLAYREDVAGGLMSPRFSTLRADMTVAQALAYLRQQSREHVETVYYVYVVDADNVLIGVTSLRDLFAAAPEEPIQAVMFTDFVKATEDMDQEKLSRLFAEHDLLAVPVVDAQGKIRGIVTIDDIVDVVQEEATEDIQKMGGTEALEAPFLEIDLLEMIRKRAGWLVLLFISEMLTANAMSQYEGEIARAVVLAVFVPLIISSGGNSGSQASTLVVRAMALGEVHLRDWSKVLRRELVAGLALGCIIGSLGLLRIIIWQLFFPGTYGPHVTQVATTVGASLVCIVLWGGISGSMLPFVLRRVGFDPASASAPFVATLVDVTGLVIYFTLASFILRGTLL
jgi:magnesium transporter